MGVVLIAITGKGDFYCEVLWFAEGVFILVGVVLIAITGKGDFYCEVLWFAEGVFMRAHIMLYAVCSVYILLAELWT